MMSLNGSRLLAVFLFAGTIPACDGSLKVGEQAAALITIYGPYPLQNAQTGLCIDGYTGSDGSNILPYMNYCNNSNPYQNWYLASETGGYPDHYCNQATNLCLDGYTAIPGNFYMQTYYPTDTYQEWIDYLGNNYGFAITNMGNSNTCIDGYAQVNQRPYLNYCNSTNSYQGWHWKTQ